MVSFLSCTYAPHTLRFVSGHALTICEILRLGKKAQYQSRKQFQPRSMTLDAKDYEKGTAPVIFDIIYTSDLASEFGSINILVAASPSLKPTFLATLLMEDYIALQGKPEQRMKSILCGDFATMSMILGLIPVQYWTNDSMVSSTDEDLHEIPNPDEKSSSSAPPPTGSSLRCTTSRRYSIPVANYDGNRPKVSFSPNDLSQLLFSIYRTLFSEVDHTERLYMRGVTPQQRLLNLRRYYDRRSFALLLKLIKDKVEVDWGTMMSKLIQLVISNKDLNLMPHLNYIQDLCVQLYIHEVYRLPIVKRHKEFCSSHQDFKFRNGPRSWKDLPPTLNIILKMPKFDIKFFMDLEPGELRFSNIFCSIIPEP
ncbi:hypothetical protein K3495_g10185 [Podosphaera aphanis]|nr:hypothetical protein K3495_g10185 [Podosphaera aphanis]